MNASALRSRDDWLSVRLADVCNPGLFRDPTQEPGKTFKYVDISGVDNQTKRIVSVQTIVGRDAPSRARKVIRVGDVLVANVRPNLNAIALVPAELDNEICSTGFTVLRPSERLHSDYLFSFVRSESFVRPLSDLVKGALYPAVTDSQVLGIEIPLPELVEQKRIAAILNEQMAAVEKTRAAAEEQALAFQALQNHVVSELFSETLSFPSSELHTLCFIRGGKRLPAGADFSRERTSFPYLRVVDFQDGSIDLRNLKFLTETIQRQIRQYIINRDDVYISIAGTIGLVGTIPDSLDGANLTENAARLVFRDKNILDRDFLAAFLNTKKAQTGIKARTNQVGQPKLALERLGTLEISVPPIALQRQIARKVVEAKRVARVACLALDEREKGFDALPATFLRRAFSGQP